jgi:hypothetical protein
MEEIMKKRIESVESAIRWLNPSLDPAIRHSVLKDLAEGTPSEVEKRRRKAHAEGTIPAILGKMARSGYWVKAGAGYYPKYTGTVWSVLTLAQLDADASSDDRLSIACSYLLDHALTDGGQFSVNGTPSATVDCLQGNLCFALWKLGCRDPRLDRAFEWMARSVTGEGIAPLEDKKAPIRYYAGKCGPGFACGANNKNPCAWGAVKVMMAFSHLPEKKQTDPIRRAVRTGIDFLLEKDPLQAEYPCGYAPKPSGNWWKFGFPVFYVTDTLQIAEVFSALGMLGDRRLKNLLEYIQSKQQPDGSWLLEYDYRGKVWTEFGEKKAPNPWVTLRAARVLKAAYG